MKKYLFILFFSLSILLAFYAFESFNYSSHKLNSSEYKFQIYQLNSEGEWEDYSKKEENFPNNESFTKKIKTVLLFKKSGTVDFKFFFKQEELKNILSYQVLYNEKKLESFILNSSHKHHISLDVSKSDKVEIYVTSQGKKEYWGEIESSFFFFSLSLNESLIVVVWLLFSLFLSYYSYYYLASFSVILFILSMISERLNFAVVSFEILFAYTFYFFTFSFFLLFIYQLLDKFKKFKVATFVNFFITLLFILLPLLFMLYALNFDHALSPESLYALFQSNGGEAYEYMEKFIDIKYMLLALFIILGIFILLYQQEKVVRKKIDNQQLIFLILIFLTITVMNESKFRLNNFIYKHIEKYQKELSLFKELQLKRKEGRVTFNAEKEGQGETYVVVIGESLNKNHMGLYGYIRETTPLLSAMKNDLILYQNAYSNHTHTVPVLSLALTEANQYNNKDYYSSPSIIDILNKADVETYWLTNQTLYGAWDNKVSVIATESKQIIALNHTIGCDVKTEQYDEALVKKLKPLLSKKSKKNRVIFIHLMGSHSSYASRYPNDTYSIYTNELKMSQKGVPIKDSQELNRYDNTVYYNDYVVSSILKLLQEKQGVNAFLYFSDHSEDIERDVGHSWEKFSYEMTEIPFLGWFSPSYKKNYFMAYDNFKKHQYELFSNDMMYDTLIGLLGIKTEHYKKVYDLSSKDYLLREENALVLHGKKNYVTPENYCYEKKNKSY